MSRFDISLLGDKALSDTLASLPEQLERKVMARATRDAGKFLLTLTQAAAPVSTDPRDPHRGKLKATLKLRTLRRRKGRVGVAIQTGTREELGISAKDKGYYPAFRELGTRKLPPLPYMRGPLHSAREGVLAVLRQAVDQGIERELFKAGG
jgi:hypothetical protein